MSIRLCKDCKGRLFDDMAKTIEDGCSDFWPEEFLAPISSEQVEIDEDEFMAAMASRGWHCCEWCNRWTREPLDEEGRGPQCRETKEGAG